MLGGWGMLLSASHGICNSLVVERSFGMMDGGGRMWFLHGMRSLDCGRGTMVVRLLRVTGVAGLRRLEKSRDFQGFSNKAETCLHEMEEDINALA